MKKLFTMLLLIVAFNTYSQSGSTQYVTDSNVEKLIDKYSTKIQASVISIAEVLQQPAEFVYSTLVRQQYVKAFTGLAVVLITIMFALIALKYASNVYDWNSGEAIEGKPEYSFGALLISIILFGLSLFITFAGSYIPDIIQGFVNPHYGALKDITELLK